MTAVFVIGAAPLFWQALQLIVRGEYVSQDTDGGACPRGVDLLAPLLGHPLHPLMAPVQAGGHMPRLARTRSRPSAGSASCRWFSCSSHLGAQLPWETRRAKPESGAIVALAFAIFALGPFLTIGGFDTGLKLPVIALRFVPFAANARMPGRAIVGVYLALGVLAAMSLLGLDRASGVRRRFSGC